MKKYEVSGPFPFRANAPGSTFRAEPDPVIERAVARGSLAEVAEAAPSTTTPPAASTPPQPTTPPVASSVPSAASPKGGHTK